LSPIKSHHPFLARVVAQPHGCLRTEDEEKEEIVARASNEGPEGIGRRKGALMELRKYRSLPSVKRALSQDALFVREMRRRLTERGFTGDICAAIHKARAEWTRGRWDNALTELQQAKDILRGRVLETPEWATI
jgi:hypothetical protein